MDNPKTLVMYHRNCPDGFGSAWAAWLKLGTEAEYLPMNYGAELPEIPDHVQNIYLVDFSLPLGTLNHWSERRRVIVIDHHKTAQESLKNFPNAIFDMDHSGAVLTWKYFWQSREIPRLLLYVEDRDLWRFKLKESQAISMLVRSVPDEFVEWSLLAERIRVEFGQCVHQGQAILGFQKKQIELDLAERHNVYLDDLIVPAVNTHNNISEVAGELAKDELIGASYFRRADGKWQWSLRSRGDYDVSEVAKRHGGGGHKNAAGFESNEPPIKV